MKKFAYKSLGSLANLVNAKAEKENRNHIDRAILLKEVLDELGEGGWELQEFNGDLIGKRENNA